MRINGNLVLNSDATGEIQNLYIERLSAAPTFNSAQKGRIYFDTTTSLYYFNDGTQWTSIATGGNATALQTEVDNLEAAVGPSVNADGTFNAAGFSGANYITSPTSVTNAILQLDSALNSHKLLSELGDVAITTPANGNLLQYNATAAKWENVVIGSASGVQAWGASLDALSAKTSTGIMVQTGANTFSSVALTAPASGLTITNPDGVAGSPTFALANGLASINALAAGATNGFVVHSATDTYITRDIVTASAGRIVVTNGDGIAGSPTIDLATVTNSGTGTFLKLTTDTYGRVTGTTPVVQTDITGLVDSVYVNVSGDTMTGQLNMGGFTITNLASPAGGTDAANKAYVDAAVNGLSWKESVRVATTGANIALATGGLLTIDGITLVAGDRVLVKDQTTASENGIYVAAAGAWTRATDMSTAAEFDGSAVFVQEGTTWAHSGFTETLVVTTVGTDPVSFSQFTGGAVYTWGTGLQDVGNTISVLLGAGIAELPTAEVGIDLYTTSSSALILTTDGSTRSTSANAQLALLLKAAGGLTQDATGLYIPAAGVTNAMLANSTVTIDVDGTGSTSLALGGTLSILGTSAQGIATSVVTGNVVITALDASATQKGVASFSSNFTVTSGAVELSTTLGKGGITNVASTVDAAANADVLSFNSTSGKWTNVTRATVLSTQSINDLGDVTVTSPVEGQVLANNGAGQFVNRSVYFLYSATAAATSHTVAHGLGQQFCNVTVVDDTNNVVIPQSIVFDSATQLTVTFTSALQCKVVVMGMA